MRQRYEVGDTVALNSVCGQEIGLGRALVVRIPGLAVHFGPQSEQIALVFSVYRVCMETPRTVSRRHGRSIMTSRIALAARSIQYVKGPCCRR